MDLGLDGVPAAVSGASRGLGYAVALELAKEGARVAICSRKQGAIDSAADSIEREGGRRPLAVEADVAQEDGARSFIERAVEEFGGLQVLVANAGGPPPGPAGAFEDAEWQEALALNFFSAVRLVRAARPHLEKATWGRIVCLTSSTVKQPSPNLALSNAPRAAVTAFAKTLASEVAASGTTVNCVMPGQILTDRLKSLTGAGLDAGPEDQAFAEMIEHIPVGRLGQPEEFAAVVAFLCSERASFVNGVNLAVDGGFLKGL